MEKFPDYNVAEKLGITPIAYVTDQEIWEKMLTPVVRALLGSITSYGEALVRETTEGLFRGDFATNLNKHLIYGKDGYVRFPYLETVHRTEYGALVIKRDGRNIKAFAWHGDIDKGKGEIIFISGLRDRRYDGNRQANDSALLSFENSHALYHRRLTEAASSLEVTIYSFLPNTRILWRQNDPGLDSFVDNPFRFVGKPAEFFEHLRKVWNTRISPGQYAVPIPDAASHVLEGYEAVAKGRGYDFLESAVSHYNVARWFEAHGYRASYKHDMQALAGYEDRFKLLAAQQVVLTRPQQSWVCILQSLPAETVPQDFKHLHFGGPIWPQDNIGPQYFWMNKPLTTRALELVPGAIELPKAS